MTILDTTAIYFDVKHGILTEIVEGLKPGAHINQVILCHDDGGVSIGCRHKQCKRESNTYNWNWCAYKNIDYRHIQAVIK